MTIRDVTLLVEDVNRFGFICAVDRDMHEYAITIRSKLDFWPAVGQFINAKVREAFVEEASPEDSLDDQPLLRGANPDGPKVKPIATSDSQRKGRFMIEHSGDSARAEERRNAERWLDLNEFATTVLGKSQWEILKVHGRFIAPALREGFFLGRSPAPEARPFIENLVAGETVPIDLKNPDGPGMYCSQGLRLDEHRQLLLVFPKEEIVALTGRQIPKKMPGSLGKASDPHSNDEGSRFHTDSLTNERSEVEVPSGTTEAAPRKAGQGTEDIIPSMKSGLAAELTDAFVSMLTLPPNPSDQLIRETAERAARLVIKVLHEPISQPQFLEARAHQPETIQSVLGGCYWLTPRHINARQKTPPKDEEQPARDWLRDGKVFSVPYQGATYFPAYQFDVACQPRTVVQDVLTALKPMTDGWALAAWFHYPNSLITRPSAGGKEALSISPKDALDMRDELLKAAASR